MYRFGFNGQHKDNEIAGIGNHNTAMFWEYDTRLAWRWNSDPVINPSISPYVVFKDNPIAKNDPFGDCTDCPVKGKKHSYSQPDKSKPAELEDFVFTEKRGVPNKYEDPLANSSAPNFTGDDYSVRSNDVNFLYSFGGNNASIYNEFRRGTGPDNSVFLDDHPLTQSVKEWDDVDVLRMGAYEKFERLKAQGKDIADNPYTNVKVGFNPFTTTSLAGQFIGSASGDVFPSKDGKTLIFVISDAKGLRSLLYHATQDIPRLEGAATPYGTTVQKYIWSEPYDATRYHKEESSKRVDGAYK